MTVPLSHLINVLHSLKSSVGSSSSASCKSRKHKERAADPELHCAEVLAVQVHFLTLALMFWAITKTLHAQCYLKKLCTLFVYSLCGIYGSWVYQIWERSSWMSWWLVCCHTWAHRKHHLHLVVRRPGGPRISPHIPFSTISMVRKMYLNISLSHIRLISVATKWLSHRPTNQLATLLQFQVAREKCTFPWWNRLHQKPSCLGF